ncbi:non-reducing end alpha-L-arabinofuranosidase family hydrolase [Glycomyces mayteni]|uniref:non-reducing end alpha-L-arabinofuranosidase n=1 Tax=Glycomyces mayteni TaxID=543887 RepID=A0ABW2D863_9ACTN|nr:hypothetical protein GCM10025732_31910 [Glycomyces mayteni]
MRILGALAVLASAAALASSSLTASAQTTGGDVGAQALPANYSWESSGQLISPKPDSSHPIVSVKDPTVVRYNNEWLVYMTTANTSGNWSLAFTRFSDWSQAASAPLTFLDRNANIGNRYAAAPQLFYFAPQNLWYLVYQTGPPSYSTSTDPTNPNSWSAPRNFISSTPPIVQQNSNGFWLDFYNICDSTMCYLFAGDDNGHVYRSETTVGEFPNNFRNTQIVLQDSKYNLFEGGAVYKLDNTNTYLLIWESIGSDGVRYYRSYTANGLTGQWQPQKTTQNAPFAGPANVSFPGGRWSADISHGELIRSGVDQTMNLDTSNLRMLYQGRNPNSGGEYSQLPYRLGLLTLTGGSTC